MEYIGIDELNKTEVNPEQLNCKHQWVLPKNIFIRFLWGLIGKDPICSKCGANDYGDYWGFTDGA